MFLSSSQSPVIRTFCTSSVGSAAEMRIVSCRTRSLSGVGNQLTSECSVSDTPCTSPLHSTQGTKIVGPRVQPGANSGGRCQVAWRRQAFVSDWSTTLLCCVNADVHSPDSCRLIL